MCLCPTSLASNVDIFFPNRAPRLVSDSGREKTVSRARQQNNFEGNCNRTIHIMLRFACIAMSVAAATAATPASTSKDCKVSRGVLLALLALSSFFFVPLAKKANPERHEAGCRVTTGMYGARPLQHAHLPTAPLLQPLAATLRAPMRRTTTRGLMKCATQSPPNDIWI